MTLNADLVRTRCQEIEDAVARLERLRTMAGFRNLLVHMYWKVDYGRVYDLMLHNLDDLRTFAGRMAALL